MTAGVDTTKERLGLGVAALPDPPRPATPLARRRAWTEPRVRFWWVLTLALLLIGLYVGGREGLAWSRETRLLRSGRLVQAEITTADGLSKRWQQVRPEAVVTLRYEVDGKVYNKTGYLKGRKEYIQVLSKVPIHVDPANPDEWTARPEPAGLMQQLAGAAVVLPVFAATLVVSLALRAKAMRLWREGEARAAIVVDSRQTALAPRSRLVRCTPAAAGDRRVVEVYLPAGAAAALQPGGEVWLLFPPGGRGRPVAAAWFE